MKKVLIMITMLFIYTNTFSEDFGYKGFAVGFNIGTDKGINALIHNGNGHGYQANLSFDFGDSDNVFDLSVDRLFFREFGPSVPYYVGVGLKVSDKSKKYFGVRGVVGISYFVTQLANDLELFGELAPTIYLTDLDNLFDIEYGIGLRYYF